MNSAIIISNSSSIKIRKSINQIVMTLPFVN